MKIYKFGEYTIVVYDTKNEIGELKGIRSLCPNNKGKPWAIEVIAEGLPRIEREWCFCHLIDRINEIYKLVLEEVK